MILVKRKNKTEVWAQFDEEAQMYELFYDEDGQSYTGWCVDTMKEARAAANYIVNEMGE